jgi:CheY-like chemotaxis protein
VVQPQTELLLNVDAVRISQALGNLLHNAAKFTPAGGEITLEARRAGEHLEIAVTDNGVGMPAEILPYVFDLFTQDERSLERSQGGLGIGLSLVRGMIEMHGGSVRAESAGRRCGSCFTIRLPVAANVAPVPEPVEPASDVRGARRVLIVEDNIDAAETLAMLLTSSGHDVTVVTDSFEATGTARQAQPEVVLLDIGLPGLDGYELARQLRGDALTRDAYLIAVSGYGQQRDRDRSAEAGFDLHLTKPVEPARLLRAIAAAERVPT